MASNDKPTSSDSSSLPRGLVSRGGTPTSKSTRLPSIRTPRDLTLGGVKKKTFVPNIPQRKEKLKTENEASTSTAPSKQPTPKQKWNERKRDDGHTGRGRGRGRGKPDVIQSHSIFEQGPTEQLKSGRGSGSSYGGGGGSGGSGGGGGFSVGDMKARIKREKPEETQRILDGLLRDDFIDDEEISTDLNPIRLPLSSYASLKEEAKTESIEPESDVSTPAKVIPHVKVGAKDIECSELFSKPGKSECPQLLFFQLPDVLPGVLPSSDNRPPQGKGQGQTADAQVKEDEEQTHKNCLQDFSEGHIGKIQVLKSGKCRLVLGNVALDVFTGTPCGFLQDVVSVNVNDDVGDMKVLGHLDYRLVCSPDFESILQTKA